MSPRARPPRSAVNTFGSPVAVVMTAILRSRLLARVLL